jgi:hypothetical protein
MTGVWAVSVQCWTSHEINQDSAEKNDAVERLSLNELPVMHRTVQILVTMYRWNCGCLRLLNNIEQIAPKAGQ